MNEKTIKRALLAGVVLAAVAAAGALLALRDEREWTSDSETALAEFQRGLEEEQKLYHDEAAERFARAVELDPDFVAAKLYLLQRLAGREHEARREALKAEVRAADLTRLTPRERFLIEHFFAVREGDSERAGALVADYRERHPDDPFALDVQCRALWYGRDFEKVEALYRRLIEIDPNWVTAQNHLGYLAMAQGDWQRAQEQFEIYRYLAPDQANPHDSLGELWLLTGRWDEARSEFEAALAIKPDFCHSWNHLVMLDLLTDRFEEAERTIEGIDRDRLCSQDEVRLQRCRLGVWRAFSRADWRGAWASYRGQGCEQHYGDASMMAYEAALLAGLDDEAAALAAEIESFLEEHVPEPERRIAALYLEGVRLRQEGRPEEAAERLRQVDSLLTYFTSAGGYFKLFTRVELWHALTAAGRDDDAARVLADLRAVNPDFAERWTAPPGTDGVAAAAAVGARPAS